MAGGVSMGDKARRTLAFLQAHGRVESWGCH